jgi:phosphatidylserine decarboxylase
MNIVSEGIPFIAVPGVLGVAGLIYLGNNPVMHAMSVLLVAVALFCIYFFRDPSRKIVDVEKQLLSPADGVVMEVSENGGEKVIRIFLSVFNVHLQRSPFAGKVVSVEHKAGKFLPAMDPAAHVENEQIVMSFDTEFGRMKVIQVAGILARRCVSWIKAGDVVEKGGKIGVIKFSSQVDIHLPASVSVSVRPGDKTVGGITALGEFK